MPSKSFGRKLGGRGASKKAGPSGPTKRLSAAKPPSQRKPPGRGKAADYKPGGGGKPGKPGGGKPGGGKPRGGKPWGGKPWGGKPGGGKPWGAYPYPGDYGSDEVVAIVLKKYCAVELLNALIIALGVVPPGGKSKGKGKGKGKGKDPKGGGYR